jgi:hypothetical protein
MIQSRVVLKRMGVGMLGGRFPAILWTSSSNPERLERSAWLKAVRTADADRR